MVGTPEGVDGHESTLRPLLTTATSLRITGMGGTDHERGEAPEIDKQIYGQWA